MAVTTTLDGWRGVLVALGLVLADVEAEPENAEYGAHIARVGAERVRYRVGKVTPKKAGLFVTVWRRAEDGTTVPLASEDAGLLVVDAHEGERRGQFVFPSSALAAHGVWSAAGVGGKRGFRVYPPWAEGLNPQATRSQRWQCEHFLDLDPLDECRGRRLYTSRWSR